MTGIVVKPITLQGTICRCLGMGSLLILFLLGSAWADDPDAHSDSTHTSVAQADARRRSYIAIPFLFYTPETKIGAGGSFGYYVRRGEQTQRPSSLQGILIGTQKKQANIVLVGEYYTQNAKGRYYAECGFSKYPDSFYGIGADTPDSLEESYASRYVFITLKAQRQLAPYVRAGLQGTLRHERVIETETDGQLKSGDIPGTGAWRTVSLGAVATLDNRDNTFYTTHGTFLELSWRVCRKAWGSDFSFDRLSLDARTFIPLGDRYVLAFQSYSDISTGDAPFQLLPRLGGNSLLRGYYAGRYRDKLMMIHQMEVRFGIWRWIRGVLFAGIGDVAKDLRGLVWRDLEYAAGGGVRFRLNDEGVYLRVDMGVTRNGERGLYITAVEAF